MRELEGLRERSVSIDQLRISDRCHVILPYHQVQDRLEEEARGKAAIGTTGLGVGPCYVDKVARSGIRWPAHRSRLPACEAVGTAPAKNRLLKGLYGHERFTVDEVIEAVEEAAAYLKPLVVDTGVLLEEALTSGRRILFEGAQGTLLDVDHGTYPYVTSSSPAAGGIATGLAYGPRAVEAVLGVVKAYTTRVGGGPFPTEDKRAGRRDPAAAGP